MSISGEAIADQAAIGYNLDTWRDVVIPVGTLLYAGYHGAPAYGKYFTDRETVLAEADGKFGFMLWGALQVKPHDTHGDRTQIREFIVTGHVEAAAGAATANAKAYWGGGGGFQYFIPDRFHHGLTVKRVIPLSSTGLI
ncbi:MAG: hypothetical protein QM820_63800 [Minicystis sp.]